MIEVDSGLISKYQRPVLIFQFCWRCTNIRCRWQWSGFNVIIWRFEQYSPTSKRLMTMQTNMVSNSPDQFHLILGAERNMFPFMMRGSSRLKPMPTCPLYKTASLINTAQDIWNVSLWHTVILDISLWESTRPWEPNNVFNNNRQDIDWHDFHFDLKWQFAYDS